MRRGPSHPCSPAFHRTGHSKGHYQHCTANRPGQRCLSVFLTTVSSQCKTRVNKVNVNKMFFSYSHWMGWDVLLVLNLQRFNKEQLSAALTMDMHDLWCWCNQSQLSPLWLMAQPGLVVTCHACSTLNQTQHTASSLQAHVDVWHQTGHGFMWLACACIFAWKKDLILQTHPGQENRWNRTTMWFCNPWHHPHLKMNVEEK